MKKLFPTHRQMRSNTIAKILEAIRDGSVSKREIQAYSSFSWGNVSQNINYLLDAGIIVSSGKALANNGKAGRQTRQFAFTSKKYLTLGMEIRAEGIECSLVNLSGDEIYSCNCKLPEPVNQKNLLPSANKALIDILNRNNLGKDSISAISFSLTGAVDVKNMLWLKTPKIKSIDNFDFKEAFRFFPGIPHISIHHDVTALAGTVKKSYPDSSGNYVLIFISDGIGMAVHTENGFISGERGLAGEIGHIPYEAVRGGLVACSCGNKNCLELFLSSGGILRRLHKSSKTVNSIMKFKETVNSLDQKQKEEVCKYIFPLLIHLAVSACNIFDPGTLFIGGEAIEFCVDFLKEAGFEEELRKKTWHSSPGKFVFYKMDSYSSAYGAASGLENQIFRDISEKSAD